MSKLYSVTITGFIATDSDPADWDNQTVLQGMYDSQVKATVLADHDDGVIAAVLERGHWESPLEAGGGWAVEQEPGPSLGWLVCPHCGMWFEPTHHNQKWCGAECRTKHHAKAQKVRLRKIKSGLHEEETA